MIVFITGASAGFGTAIARRFAADGAKLILAGRRTERLEKLQHELGGWTNAHVMTLDVRQREAVSAAIEALAMVTGRRLAAL